MKKSLCIQCGKCLTTCPVDAIYQDSVGDVFVCIHCGLCVSFCPQNCLEMIDSSRIEEVLI